MYTQKNFCVSLLGLRWNDWSTYTPAQAPKTSALLYLKHQRCCVAVGLQPSPGVQYHYSTAPGRDGSLSSLHSAQYK